MPRKKAQKRKLMIDLFCGCGGMSLGFEQVGFKTILAVDNWEPACETYKANFPKAEVICKDIERVSDKELKKIINSRRINLIIGGPPCQGFSIAGKRDPKDPRSSLFREFVRVVDLVRPAYFVMENVEGLHSMKTKNGSMVIDIICDEFERIGYRVKCRVLDAADYRVPQHRHRIFFIGTNTNAGIFFPPIKILFGKYKTVRDAMGDLEPLESGEKSKKDKWHFAFNHPKHQIEWMRDVPEGGTAHDNPDPDNRPPSGFRTTYKRIWWDRPSPAVTTCFGAISSQNNVHPRDTRALTIREAARLQTFPDSFEWKGSTNQIRIQIGNAVPPLLAKCIGESIGRSSAARKHGKKR